MTIRAVIDTHAILWYLYNDSRLSEIARTFMDKVDVAGDQLALSTIVLAEILYLAEKRRIDPAALDRVLEVLNRINSLFVEIPLDHRIIRSMQRIDRSQVPELPDRIIAATAHFLGVPTVSHDRNIQSSVVSTIW